MGSMTIGGSMMQEPQPQKVTVDCYTTAYGHVKCEATK